MVNRKDTARINLHVNEELRTKVKTMASMEQKSIKDFIVEAIEKQINEKENQNKGE